MNKSCYLFPDDARKKLLSKYCNSGSKMFALVTEEQSFPITLRLNKPKEEDIRSNIGGFNEYINSWRKVENQVDVVYKKINYTILSEQIVPNQIVFENLTDFIVFLGKSFGESILEFKEKYDYFFEFCITNGVSREKINQNIIFISNKIYEYEIELLKNVISVAFKIEEGMADNKFIRQIYIDDEKFNTKFIENNESLIRTIVNIRYNILLKDFSSLLHWLNAKIISDNFITIVPLCSKIKSLFLGSSVLKIEEIDFSIPKFDTGLIENIVIVENYQSGYALPQLKNTLAIIGLGKNTKFLNAKWLRTKKVYYWGDIDVDGLLILSNVINYLPQCIPVLMSKDVFEDNKAYGCEDINVFKNIPNALPNEYKELFKTLNRKEGYTRLEQEFLSTNLINKTLRQLINN